MSGYDSQLPAPPTILGVNAAVNFAAGVPGTAGKTMDTILMSVLILKNAGPATLTFNSGFRDHANAQNTTNYVLSGSTTVDTAYYFAPGLINSAGPLQMTASVANTVIVQTQAAALSA